MSSSVRSLKVIYDRLVAERMLTHTHIDVHFKRYLVEKFHLDSEVPVTSVQRCSWKAQPQLADLNQIKASLIASAVQGSRNENVKPSVFLQHCVPWLSSSSSSSRRDVRRGCTSCQSFFFILLISESDKTSVVTSLLLPETCPCVRLSVLPPSVNLSSSWCLWRCWSIYEINTFLWKGPRLHFTVFIMWEIKLRN